MSHLAPVAQGIGITVLITVFGFAIGAIGGIPLVLARRSRFFPLRFIAHVFIEFLRGIPPLVWLFIIFFGLGTGIIQLNPFTAAIAGFGAISAAYMAEIYRGSLFAIDAGQREASDALALSHLATAWHVIGPQMLRISIPAAAAYGIGLIKESSVASVIGVQDILYRANQDAQQTSEAIVPFLFAAGLYIALTVPSAWATRWLDSHLRARVSR